MKLDFEQRREAIELEEWVADCPDSTSAQIVSLRSECRRLRDELEAALASAPADGYKLVPVEPNRKMLEELRDRYTGDLIAARQAYFAMIAAAPQRGK